MPGADPNHDAQVAAAQAAAKAFVASPSAESAKKLRAAIDTIVWSD
jgi:hypothetical protein